MLDVSEATATRLIKKAINKFFSGNTDDYDTIWDNRIELIGRDGRMKDYATLVVTSSHITITFTNVRMGQFAAYGSYDRKACTYSGDRMPYFILPMLKEFVLATSLAGLEDGQLQLQPTASR